VSDLPTGSQVPVAFTPDGQQSERPLVDLQAHTAVRFVVHHGTQDLGAEGPTAAWVGALRHDATQSLMSIIRVPEAMPVVAKPISGAGARRHRPMGLRRRTARSDDPRGATALTTDTRTQMADTRQWLADLAEKSAGRLRAADVLTRAWQPKELVPKFAQVWR
jgi:hypothetical protein